MEGDPNTALVIALLLSSFNHHVIQVKCLYMFVLNP